VCLLETPESQTSAEELGYQNEKYGESPGLYYEQLGEITLYNTSLGQTDREIDQIGQYINHVNQLCRVTEIQNWTDCSHFNFYSRDILKQIKESENVLRELIGKDQKP
jgi:hypothetical protein